MHNAFFETHNTLSSVEPLFSLFVKYYDNLCLAFIVYVFNDVGASYGFFMYIHKLHI